MKFVTSPKLFLILVNNYSIDSIFDFPLASLSNRLSFYASATPLCIYDNI